MSDSLPPGWRVGQTHSGRPYYINDTEKITQWAHPGQSNGNTNGPSAPNESNVPSAWEVLLDDGRWLRFTNECNQLIISKLAQGTHRVNIGTNRVVDLQALTQTRTDTGNVRRIRACLTNVPMQSAVDPINLDIHFVQWEVEGDGTWIALDSALSNKLTEAATKEGASRKVQCDVLRIADVEDMCQTRTDTGRKRELRTVQWKYRSNSGDIRNFNIADATKLCDAQHRSHMIGKAAGMVVQLEAGNADIAQQTYLTSTNELHTLLTVPFVLNSAFQNAAYVSGSASSHVPESTMVWQVLTDSGWMIYDTKNSNILSAAYRLHKSSAIIRGPQRVPGTCTAYKVDFATMQQTRADGSSVVPRSVRLEFRDQSSTGMLDNASNAAVNGGGTPAAPVANTLPGMAGSTASEGATAPPAGVNLTEPAEPAEIEIPQDFCCPITQDLFEDPVIAMDGHTYERSYVVEWFQTHETSPYTGEVMESKNLVPNHRLKSIVREWREKNGM